MFSCLIPGPRYPPVPTERSQGIDIVPGYGVYSKFFCVTGGVLRGGIGSHSEPASARTRVGDALHFTAMLIGHKTLL